MSLKRRQTCPITTSFMALEGCPLMQEAGRLCFNSNKGATHHLADWLSTKRNAGLVAVQGGNVLGFVLYTVQIQKKQVVFHQLAVRPAHRRPA
jgi:hypothetical protein